MEQEKKLICVLCGQEWGEFNNVCENKSCKGFCSWGYEPMKPESFFVDNEGKWHLKPATSNDTPKAKALELCNKFMICNSYQAIVWYNAKICASIAVDEVISIKLLWYQKDTKELDYWNEVKKEIQIL